jgi:hypothetical protein
LRARKRRECTTATNPAWRVAKLQSLRSPPHSLYSFPPPLAICAAPPSPPLLHLRNPILASAPLTGAAPTHPMDAPTSLLRAYIRDLAKPYRMTCRLGVQVDAALAERLRPGLGGRRWSSPTAPVHARFPPQYLGSRSDFSGKKSGGGKRSVRIRRLCAWIRLPRASRSSRSWR